MKKEKLYKNSTEKLIVYPNGRKVKRVLKEYEIDMGERGIYNNKHSPININTSK